MSLEGHQIDRYRILRLLGSGGMGDVYLAEDARIEQQVAIKVIRAEASHYPNAQATQEAARLFQREAKAIVKLDHPHILPLNAYGEERLGNMTIIYLVMPYRQEGSLSDWLRQRGQAGLLSPAEVAHFVGQAASALQHAHDRQIIHQDVKPSNFLLRYRQETPTRPDLLLADFGIARFSTATSSASQSIRGTPTSMAPEQWEGHPVPATDQYALAVMAYELLTGRPPFQGAPGPLMFQHLTVPPPPLSSVNPRLSGDLDAVLLHALAKRPEQRFATMAAFTNAFQQAAQGMQEGNAPTYLSAPLKPASQGDIRAVLAISTTEAQTGTTRTLTLPGGRRVTVPLPAGARDGQIVRLDGQGEASSTGGPTGALILTLLVKAAEEPPPFASSGTENTILTANPAAAAPGARMIPLNQPGQPTGVVPADRSSRYPETVAAQRRSFTEERSPGTPQPAQQGISRRTVVMGLAGLAAIGVAGGGLLWLAGSLQPFAPLPTPTPKPILSLASDLVNAGRLTVGTVANNPPQEYISGDGKIIGFDIELIVAVAVKMHLNVQIVAAPDFKALFDGLTNKKFDVAISAVSMTPALTAQFDFVPYLKTSQSLLVPTGAKGIKGLADLCGNSVGVQDGSTELTELQTFACPAGQMITIMKGASEADAVVLLLEGAVNATYLDTPAANYYMMPNQGKFDIVATPSSAPDEGIMIRKGDTLMFNAVKAAFISLLKDGTYSMLIQKWGLTQEGL